MAPDDRNIDAQLLQTLLRPVVRFGLRRSLAIQDFVRALKVVLVEEAAREIEKSGEKINVSRLSVMTGLYRKEVTKIYRENEAPSNEAASILARVIGSWRSDPRFLTKAGDPRVLSIKGLESEFADLVRSVSQNLNPGTILFELKRLGAIEPTAQGKMKLVRPYRPFNRDPRKGFALMSQDINSLIEAGEENLLDPQEIANLHIRTEFDNISRAELKGIREWLMKEGKAFQRRVRLFLSGFDKDVNPEIEDPRPGATVTFTLFAHTPPLEEDPVVQNAAP